MSRALEGPRLPPARGGPPDAVVVLLHGYGSNGEDLIGLAPYWRGALPGALFIAPNAPEPCPGAPGGFQWWGFPTAPGAVERAVDDVEAFCDAELAAAGLDGRRLALVGFSQGTMLALAAGPRRIPAIAGIAGYSGRLANAEALDRVAGRSPILLIHGGADPMIEASHFHATRAALEKAGFPVEAHLNPGLGHSIDPGGVSLGGRFLARVLA